MSNKKIPTQPFGKTGHNSTRVIFGSAALGSATQDEADKALDILLEYGINHIDTAPGYGEAELRIGPWMKKQRKDFFLATKLDQAGYEQAKEQIERSLERLQTDHVDLLQFHNLTDSVFWEAVFNEGGAIEAAKEAKEKGLTRFIGITGHGLQAPDMHLDSLKQYDFDSVLAPYNYLLMQHPDYSKSFKRLFNYCKENNIALQTIKSAARRHWDGKKKTHTTWYEPLNNPEAVKKAIQWSMGKEYIFLISTGDLQVLPLFLEAAATYESQTLVSEMRELVEKEEMVRLFH